MLFVGSLLHFLKVSCLMSAPLCTTPPSSARLPPPTDNVLYLDPRDRSSSSAPGASLPWTYVGGDSVPLYYYCTKFECVFTVSHMQRSGPVWVERVLTTHESRLSSTLQNWVGVGGCWMVVWGQRPYAKDIYINKHVCHMIFKYMCHCG